MSQYPPPQDPNPFSRPSLNQPSFNQPMHPHQQPPKQENGVGLTGFIVSLVGLFLCGIPSLIGLIISAFGLKKEPRGLAIAGVILGLVGLVELGLVAVSTYQAVRVTQQSFNQIRAQLAEIPMEEAASDIGSKWQEQGRIPTQEEGDEMLVGKNDMMNNSLVYETDGESFSIRSAGMDGVLETEDDVVVGPFEDPLIAIDLGYDYDELDLDELEDEEMEVEEDSDGAESKDLMAE